MLFFNFQTTLSLLFISGVGFSSLATAIPAPTARESPTPTSCMSICVTPTVTTYPTEIHCPNQPVATLGLCPRIVCLREPTQTATSTYFCHGNSCKDYDLPTTNCDSLPPVTVLGNPCWTGCPVPCPPPVTTVGIACAVPWPAGITGA